MSTPAYLDAERAVLGSMLTTEPAIEAVITTGLTADDFSHRQRHGYVFEAILELHRKGEPADPITVAALLEKRGQSEEVGGRDAIAGLAATTPAPGNAATYAGMVKEARNGPSSTRSDLLSEFRVDLIERIREGIPEREFVPGCEEWLLRGKRYLLFASAGVGKSLAVLVVAVEVVAQGGRAVILDVENGSDEYARRLEAVLGARVDALADACQERLRYYEFPALRLGWTPEEWARSIGGVDLVVFDSSRMTLSSVGLSEDANDDYAAFVNALVVPLARANSTTLILDNVGHGDGGHPRGASAKGDLNEVVFELNAVESFDSETRGKVVWGRRRQRFSGVPVAMEQVIGGGAFELPKPLVQDRDGKGADKKPFRPTYLMEQASRLIEAEPGKSTSFIDEHIKGKRTAVFAAVQRLIEEGYVRTEDGPRNSQLHFSITPYREADDAENGDLNDQFPTSSPTGSQASGVDPARPVPPSGSSPKGRTAGTGQRPTGSPSGSRRTTTESAPLFGAGVEGNASNGAAGCLSHHDDPQPETCRYCRQTQERDRG